MDQAIKGSRSNLRLKKNLSGDILPSWAKCFGQLILEEEDKMRKEKKINNFDLS